MHADLFLQMSMHVLSVHILCVYRVPSCCVLSPAPTQQCCVQASVHVTRGKNSMRVYSVITVCSLIWMCILVSLSPSTIICYAGSFTIAGRLDFFITHTHTHTLTHILTHTHTNTIMVCAL